MMLNFSKLLFLSLALRIAFVTAMTVVAILSLVPQETLPPTVEHHDKIFHALVYGGLGLLGRLAFPSSSGLWLIVAGVPLLGGMIELAQAFVPGRFPSVFDAVANAAGAAFGVAAVTFILRPHQRRMLRAYRASCPCASRGRAPG